MAGESVNENIYLAITFGYGGQKRFQKPPLAIADLVLIYFRGRPREKTLEDQS